jgi:hypothetical protein
MPHEFTILGRGRAGRALAVAWGDRAALEPSSSNPSGLVLLAVPDRAVAEAAARFPGRCVHLSFGGRAADWKGTPLALTGAVPAVLVRAFADLGFEPFELSAELKPLYHACAVLTSGHAATLWLGAAKLLADRGVNLPGRGLMALAEATQRNVARQGREGRTGPFARGDEATIERDAAALPEPWRELFLKLGRADV